MTAGTAVQTPIQRALGLQVEADSPLTEDDVERIANDVIQAAAAVGKTIEEYVVDYAKELDVQAPHTGMKSAFWSYGIPHPDLPTDKVLSSQFLAAIWSDMENDSRPGSARYLEGTPGGHALGLLHLWDPEVQEALHLDKTKGNALARQAWGALSENYAKATDGEAILFAGELAPWSVAYETELPQLRKTIGADNIHFMYDLSEQTLQGLPPESQQLLSESRVRSHVHFFAPDPESPPPQKYWESGYLDLDHLKSLSTPEAQRAAILEVCEQVTLLDQQQAEAEAEKAAERNPDLGAEQEATAPGLGEQQPAPVLDAEQTPTPPAAKSGPPAVASTHGVYLPGVEVNAKVAARPTPPLDAAPQTAPGMHFLPGVTVKPSSAPSVPATSVPTPPTPEQAQAAGMGE
ncbi:hypothetical protein [Streptomyces sp. NPDC057438]|uniref:hypothetical protein n=1 Tax=Streptomyces sp. NPDC057438 TaxID=3346133 RepID=UPI0036A248B0